MLIYIDGGTDRYQVLEAAQAIKGDQSVNPGLPRAGALSTRLFFLSSPVILMSLAEGLSCPFHTFCLVKSQHRLENCDIRVSGSPPWALEDWLQQVELLRTLPGSLQLEVVIAQCSLPGAGQQCCSCVEIPPESWSRTVRGRLAVHSIDSFLQSWGWPLGKHSAVYNSAYVHCRWGLWVSQKGSALLLCPKRLAESQLYGNGRKGGGGSLLPALILKIQEARLLSNPL